MTEKRFTRHKSLDGDCTIYDELNDFQFPSLPLGVSKIFSDKLNELHEENITLKSELSFSQNQNRELRKVLKDNRSMAEVVEENNELKADNKRMVKFIMSKGYTLKDYLDWLKDVVWK